MIISLVSDCFNSVLNKCYLKLNFLIQNLTDAFSIPSFGQSNFLSIWYSETNARDNVFIVATSK